MATTTFISSQWNFFFTHIEFNLRQILKIKVAIPSKYCFMEHQDLMNMWEVPSWPRERQVFSSSMGSIMRSYFKWAYLQIEKEFLMKRSNHGIFKIYIKFTVNSYPGSYISKQCKPRNDPKTWKLINFKCLEIVIFQNVSSGDVLCKNALKNLCYGSALLSLQFIYGLFQVLIKWTCALYQIFLKPLGTTWIQRFYKLCIIIWKKIIWKKLFEFVFKQVFLLIRNFHIHNHLEKQRKHIWQGYLWIILFCDITSPKHVLLNFEVRHTVKVLQFLKKIEYCYSFNGEYFNLAIEFGCNCDPELKGELSLWRKKNSFILLDVNRISKII